LERRRISKRDLGRGRQIGARHAGLAGLLGRSKDPLSKLALIAAVLAVVFSVALPVLQQASRAPDLPQWDMAHHGLDGLRLSQAVEAGEVWDFFGHLHEMSVWPPLFPLLEAPAFFVFGPDYSVPRVFVAFLFILSLGLALQAGLALGGRHGLAIGLVTLAALAASPFHQLFGTLVMLEVPGALLLLLALAAYWRALETDAAGDWRGAAISASALFFCKFNYGLLWLVPLGLAEARAAAGSWLGLSRWGRAMGRYFVRRFSALTFSLVGLVFLAVYRWGGGLELELGGRVFRSQSLGTPAYLLYVVFLAFLAFKLRRRGKEAWAWWAELEMRHRAWILWIVLPVALWMLAPSHVKDLLGFLENRDSGLGFWNLETWLFYPIAFAEQYAPNPIVGWGALALAAGFLARFPRLDARRQVLALALGVALVAVFLHPYKLSRFFFPAAPLVWLAAAVMLADGAAALGRRLALGRNEVLAPLALAGLALLAAALAGVDTGRLEEDFAARTVPPAVEEVLDGMAGICREGEPSILLGAWNELSPSLIEWHLRQSAPGSSECLVAARDWVGEGSAAELQRRLETSGGETRVLVLERLPGIDPREEAEFRESTAWLAPVRGRLARDPSFEEAETREYPAAGYRLSIYRPSVSSAGG